MEEGAVPTCLSVGSFLVSFGATQKEAVFCFIVLFIYFGCARSSLMLGLFSTYGERDLLFIATHGFLNVECGHMGSEVAVPRL